MIREDQLEELTEAYIRPPIVIMAEEHAEKLTCRICGRQYISSGKKDPGFCRDCLREMDEENAMLVGGPLDGERAHEK